ncbi:MAG TPA: phosphodiester glycosidase family protein [Candidatus Obscuribacter sp.]|nr:phosphodiester glycosidase family protein [Candidatus Obscuribacter sp.]HND06917.1 phosphodiester glycosidase family protein [Candidatus Obscuribacter sp.]
MSRTKQITAALCFTLALLVSPGAALRAQDKNEAQPAEPEEAFPAFQMDSLQQFLSPALLMKGKVAFDPGLKVYCFTYKSCRVSLLLLDSKKLTLKPALASSGTEPTEMVAAGRGAVAATNGGYFNLSDGKSTSFVVLDGRLVADPRENNALTGNPRLTAFLPKIYERSELRVYQDKLGKISYAIAAHSDAVPTTLTLKHSLQGGPRLLPQLTAEAEAFLRTESDGKVVDSIGVNRTAARTAVAFLKDGRALLVSCAGKGQDEFSSGLTLADLSDLLKSIGAVEALNFDGGTSTTMVCRVKDSKSSAKSYTMLIGRKPQTRVRSVLQVVGR